MKIDLRSDTITKPSSPMLNAMFAATVGDDVFGDDPTVSEFEHKVAQLFGMEAGLFCPSGTMANQLAIKVHTSPGGQVICHKNSHVYLYEGGGIALNSNCSVKLLDGEFGLLSAVDVKEAINDKDDIHFPISQLVSLENTMNKGGGACYNFEDFVAIKEVCIQNGLKLHLDGARLFNAIVANGESTLAYGSVFDTISICFSKGLGCPIGSVLIGSKEDIKSARRARKAMGGGWRQAGYLAAAGLFALENNIERLSEDHRRAKEIGEVLSTLGFVKNVYPVHTNIVIFELKEEVSGIDFVANLLEKDIHVVTFGKNLVRIVTHLDFDEEQLELLIKTLLALSI
ncbi:L-threonine aldolase [Spirosomataceae bacterium TFI 002]|nr:L-threonine aldolase [Spirosomataceae bacterium TFI 002]